MGKTAKTKNEFESNRGAVDINGAAETEENTTLTNFAHGRPHGSLYSPAEKTHLPDDEAEIPRGRRGTEPSTLEERKDIQDGRFRKEKTSSVPRRDRTADRSIQTYAFGRKRSSFAQDTSPARISKPKKRCKNRKTKRFPIETDNDMRSRSVYQ